MKIPPHNPWKRLDRKAIYSNAWFQLWEDSVINPRGGRNQYGLVSFKNFAIGIVPLDEHLHTWLVGQPRYALDAYSWEIPMGGGPVEVAPLVSAQRELREETGLRAERWEEVARIHTSNSITDEVGIAFMAQGLSEGETDFDETEDLAIWKLPLAEAVAMALDGRITDSLSVVALLKVGRMHGL